ncbi:hypothetical protein [Nonlabens ulvanivorans]|uniref:Lipoprotein n=1 Tax=Nonlabens ulvanivorans TaxID=906888 RepID=A0ABX5E768_NONUL|nr:hypothetical protein [Nonlabens ulvanivorans]PRX15006.1 hypothetical protein LY02_00218 [Nonlabens ulvanivorans]
MCGSSCSNKNTKSEISDYLNSNNYHELFLTLKYPKSPAVESIETRYSSIIEDSLFILRPNRNNNLRIYPTESVKDLILQESDDSYTMIGVIYDFKSIDSIVQNKDYTHFMVYTKYSLKGVSKIYESDGLTFDANDLLPSKIVTFTFNNTLLGLELVSIDDPNIYHSGK